MNTLATVVTLTGRAWAVTADGQRRKLKEGDSLRGDEMLVTEPGARVDLDFDNNQMLTFLGEQQQNIGEAIEFAQAELPPSAPRPAAEGRQQPQAQPAQADGEPEGHNFVQLVRINEIIEADGITPLTVARIQELLRPLGMSLPERVYDLDEWREHRGGDERYGGAATGGIDIDRTPPELVDDLPALDNWDADSVEVDLGDYFTDNSSGPATYEVEGLPPGLSYDPGTGKVTGTVDKSASQGGPDGDGSYP